MVGRLFLDANVLYSAAWRPEAGVVALWSLERATLVTSSYAVEEARRNLAQADQRRRLEELLRTVEVVEAGTLAEVDREGVRLPEKDWPIVAGAVSAAGTHLVTGDVRDFGPYFGARIAGILVLPPAEVLRMARGRGR